MMFYSIDVRDQNNLVLSFCSGLAKKCMGAEYTCTIMKGEIYMFNLFKKKKITEDPILKELNRQTEELREIRKSFESNGEKTEQSIKEAEELLKSRGYTDEDLDRIKRKSQMKIVK